MFIPKLITCQTVVFDSCCWCPGAGDVTFEEERQEEACEPTPVREWQPDDVI